MAHDEGRRETLVERRVTDSLEMDGRFLPIENVPARVNIDTGEQLFSPETVERLQTMIHGGDEPVRLVQTPVCHFAG